jgi:Flp pilus assembly protein TadG
MMRLNATTKVIDGESAARANANVASGRTSKLAHLLATESGSGLVEYAIVFVVLMTMLLAIADFSRALYAYHYVSSAARDAARYAMVRGCTPTTTTCPTAATSGDITTFVQKVPLGIDSTKVSATTTWTPDHKIGSTVQVEVDYTFNFMFPFVSSSTLSMKSTSEMIISQ